MSAPSVLTGPPRESRRILLDGMITWTTVDGDELVTGDGRRVAIDEARHLPPCEPTKILAVHLNYVSRATEFKRSLEGETPNFFQKPVSSLNSHRGHLIRPADCQWLNYEGEIAAIVGHPMRNVAPEDVWSHLAGFAPANDVGAHDFRDTDLGSMLRVKGQDSFCPIGPGIVSGVDIRESTLRTYINGIVVQAAPVSEMVWGIDYLLADLCRHITLVPGDVVLTGTPWYSRPMDVGDLVEVEVEGVGRLSNLVVEGPAPAHEVGHQPTSSKTVRAVAMGKDYFRAKNQGLGQTARDYFKVRDEYLQHNRAEGPQPLPRP
ncbi:MAG TPA: FAA hydrolase family protein [Acidimicrobiales bacterium]|nr:FAA hydrolase family protein [Acidimicrobiales bacterium]